MLTLKFVESILKKKRATKGNDFDKLIILSRIEEIHNELSKLCDEWAWQYPV